MFFIAYLSSSPPLQLLWRSVEQVRSIYLCSTVVVSLSAIFSHIHVLSYIDALTVSVVAHKAVAKIAQTRCIQSLVRLPTSAVAQTHKQLVHKQLV